MGQNSSIEWTDATWNPVRGCTRISPGCVNCYAERMAARDLPGLKSPTTKEPFAIITPSGPRWTGKVELIPHMLDVPLRRRKPTTYFANSMSDLFHEALSDEAIDRVFAVMALCPQHTFQVLTKRADRMRAWFRGKALYQRVLDAANPIRYRRPALMSIPISDLESFPLPNVHLGVSVENQEYADKRIDDLRETPAAVRFVSYEPALGPVDFSRWLKRGLRIDLEPLATLPIGVSHTEKWPRLDQIIIGGESGPGARPFDIAWARNTIAQCRAAGVACFVKQLGAKPYVDGRAAQNQWEADVIPHWPGGILFREDNTVILRDKKGGDMSEWPADLRVRQMPEAAR